MEGAVEPIQWEEDRDKTIVRAWQDNNHFLTFLPVPFFAGDFFLFLGAVFFLVFVFAGRARNFPLGRDVSRAVIRSRATVRSIGFNCSTVFVLSILRMRSRASDTSIVSIGSSRRGSDVFSSCGCDSSAGILFTLSRVYEKKGNINDAIDMISKAIRIEPDNPSLKSRLSHLNYLKATTPGSTLPTFEPQSETGHQEGTEDKRIGELIKDASLGRKDRLLLAHFYIETGNLDKAEDQFKYLLNKGFARNTVLVGLAEVMEKRNDLSGAIKLLENEKYNFSWDPKYRGVLGLYYLKAGMKKKASIEFSEALKINPELEIAKKGKRLLENDD